MIKQAAIDRVKEAFGNFKAGIVGQQLRVVRFHLLQKFYVRMLAVGDTAQLLHHQTDVVIVEVDTLFHRLLHGVPVRLLKALLRPGGHFQKAPILRVKTLQDGLCN